MSHNVLVNALFDFPGGWFAFVIGGSALLLVLIILIIVLEAMVLFWFRYGSLKRSLGASFLMNLFSSILGYFAASFLERSQEGVPGYYGGVPEITEWFLFSDSIQFPELLPATMLFLLISWVISVVSEGGVLVLLRAGRPTRTVWAITLIANVFSYILLLGPYIWIFLVPNSRPQLIALVTLNIGMFFMATLHSLALWPIPVIGLLCGLFIWWLVSRRKTT